MPSKGSKHSREIDRLRKEGLSDGQIAERLGIGKSIVHRNLYDARSQQRLAKLVAQTGLYALKQVFSAAEVVWRWTDLERLKLLEGKSALSAENIGTIMRCQERSLALAKALLGRLPMAVAATLEDPEPPPHRAPTSATDPVSKAEATLRELEAKNRSQPIQGRA